MIVETYQNLQQLLKEERRRCDILLVWSMESFARSLQEIIASIKQLTEAGVDIYFYEQRLSTRNQRGKAFLQSVSLLAGLRTVSDQRGRAVGRTKRILEMHREGVSAVEIARVLRIDLSQVQPVIIDALEKQTSLTRRETLAGNVEPHDRQRISELYRSGLTIHRIARLLKMSSTQVQSVVIYRLSEGPPPTISTAAL